MSLSEVDKQPLLSSTPENDFESQLPESPEILRSKTRRLLVSPFVVVGSLVLNIILTVTTVAQRVELSHSNVWRGALPLFSPVDHLITHENVVFTPLTAKTKYNGPPTPEVDAAWNALHRRGISSISKSEAARIWNRTLPWPGDEEDYIVSLDVFHILHCLDKIRQSFWPDYYPDDGGRIQNLTDVSTGETVEFDHTDHCINMIRESIMCNADVTPNVWKWNKYDKLGQVRFDTIHTCRKWEPIHQWSLDHHVPLKFNQSVHVVDDLDFPDDRDG